MQIVTQKYLKRISDVLVWCEANATALGSVPAFPTLVSTLRNQETLIQTVATEQAQSGGSATQNVILKAQLIDALRQDNDNLVRGAKVIDMAQPGFSAHFPASGSQGEEAVVAASRLYLENLNVQARLDAFLQLGMPADLKTDLANDIARFDLYYNDKTSATQERIAALKTLEDAIADSSQIIDSLDAIVHFKYGSDPLKLDSWKQAKRLEKARAHRAAPPSV